jgi:hypothetical protein
VSGTRVDKPMSHRAPTDPGRKPTRRPRGLVVVLLAVALAVGATVWGINASGSSPLDVLSVSKPQPPDAHASSSRHSGVPPQASPHSASSRVRTTPAQVGRAYPAQIDPERPRAVTLASGTTMRVRQSATSTSGSLQIPADIKQAGWWDGSSKLGDPFGAIVIAAHVDSFTQGLGRFAQLLSMKPGDVIRLQSAHLSQSFRVVSAGLVSKTTISATSDVFSATGSPRLVLITCGGQFDPAHGGYQSNMVVVANAEQPPERLG